MKGKKLKWVRPSDAKIVAHAKALGIETKGKSVTELYRQINDWHLASVMGWKEKRP